MIHSFGLLMRAGVCLMFCQIWDGACFDAQFLKSKFNDIRAHIQKRVTNWQQSGTAISL
jgi:hypothetical protein